MFSRCRLAALLIGLFTPMPLFAVTMPSGFSETVVAGGLESPTAFVFTPDGRILITEKSGSIRLLKNGVLGDEPMATIAVTSDLERGLLGIVLDPAFAANGFAYIYYTSSAQSCPMSECGRALGPGEHAVSRDPTPVQNRVSRITLEGDHVVPESEVILLDGIPSDSGRHNAGDLQFGPDGKLYISTGDGGETYEKSQYLTSLAGKILRINADGTVPEDNPFTNSRLRDEVWCYGLRNPWRFTFDAVGRLFIGDVGAETFEEVDLGEAGFNYGWPEEEGPRVVHYEAPLYSYQHPASGGAAITVGVFTTSVSPYPPAYQRQLFFADLVQGSISTLHYDELTRSAVVAPFATSAGMPVDFGLGLDGSVLYLSFNDGELRRIDYRDAAAE